MITRIAHLCLTSTDLARTEWFYCDVLGLERGFEFLRDGERFGFYLNVGEGNFIEVFHADALDAERVGHGIRHFCLEVEDVAAVEARLQEHGLAPWGRKLGADQSWQVWCKDPDGIPIEFHEYTDASSQRTGNPCIVDW